MFDKGLLMVHYIPGFRGGNTREDRDHIINQSSTVSNFLLRKRGSASFVSSRMSSCFCVLSVNNVSLVAAM